MSFFFKRLKEIVQVFIKQVRICAKKRLSQKGPKLRLTNSLSSNKKILKDLMTIVLQCKFPTDMVIKKTSVLKKPKHLIHI